VSPTDGNTKENLWNQGRTVGKVEERMPKITRVMKLISPLFQSIRGQQRLTLEERSKKGSGKKKGTAREGVRSAEKNPRSRKPISVRKKGTPLCGKLLGREAEGKRRTGRGQKGKDPTRKMQRALSSPRLSTGGRVAKETQQGGGQSWGT